MLHKLKITNIGENNFFNCVLTELNAIKKTS